MMVAFPSAHDTGGCIKLMVQMHKKKIIKRLGGHNAEGVRKGIIFI